MGEIRLAFLENYLLLGSNYYIEEGEKAKL